MSRPFDRLTIHSLRSIQDLELPGLGQFNLMVGGNDSGKTTVLEAVALYCNPLDPIAWHAMSEQRDPLKGLFSGLSARAVRLDELRWLFPQRENQEKDEPYEGYVHLSADGSFPIREVRAHYRELRSHLSRRPPLPSNFALKTPHRGSWEFHRERRGAEFQLQAVPGPEPRTLALWAGEQWPEETIVPTGPSLPFRLIHPADPYIYSFPVEEFTEARLGGMQDAVKELLRGFDPRIQGVEILAPQGQPEIYLQDSVAGLAPVSAFGDGIRRALFFALAIPSIADGVVLIDEIETAIHISALSRVFRWLREACQQYRIQLFATTHSLEAVDAILGTDTTPQEDIVGFRLDRGTDRTTAQRYGEDLLKRLRYERGLDVR